jgi:hypothetical protein
LITSEKQRTQKSWSIESKAEVISSKLDNLSPVPITPSGTLALKQAVGTIYSAMIDGTATNPTNNLTPVSVRDSGTTKLLKNAVADFYTIPSQQYLPASNTINTSGSYFLYQNTGAITISADEVTLDLNGFTVNGTITINANRVTVKNDKVDGTITFTDGTQNNRTEKVDLTGTITGGTSGSPIINVIINNCQITGSIGTVFTAQGASITNNYIKGNITLGTGSTNVTINNCHVLGSMITTAGTVTDTTITNCSIDSGSITLNSGATQTEINTCQFSSGNISLTSVTQTNIYNCQINNGRFSANNSSYLYLKNCCLNVPNGNTGVTIQGACNNVVLINCKALNLNTSTYGF